MENKSDNDSDRFTLAIAAFSAEPERITRFGRLLSRKPEGSLYAVLSEINETVLRRKLTLTTESNMRMVLDVAERRVLTVLETPQSAAAYSGATVGRTLGENDAALLLRVLEAFCVEGSDIFVNAQLPEPEAPAVFDGVSARLLHEQIEKTRPADMPPGFVQAVDASQAHALAIVVAKDGDAFLNWGDEDACARFAKIAFDWPGTSETIGKVMLWHGAFEHGQAVVRAEADRCVGFVLCAADGLLPCFTLWKDALLPHQGD